MPRVVSLFLPTWPTDRVRRTLAAAAPSRDVPLVLVGHDGRRRVVTAADVAARRVGLRVGMPATKAQALVADLVMMDAEPLADAEALERLAIWALQRYAPIAAADPPDGLVIDTSGADHLHGGEETMLAGMVQRFSSVGIAARVAVADCWGAAHATARHRPGDATIVPCAHGGEVIFDLPIGALRLPAPSGYRSSTSSSSSRSSNTRRTS
nr:DNA polymerase Y family protein [Beijerinckia sp. L45]